MAYGAIKGPWNDNQKESRVNDSQVEKDIVAKGLAAPRVTMADIEANIESEHYFPASVGMHYLGSKYVMNSGGLSARASFEALDLLTICVLVLHNGFTVTGESACASPENFDAEIGRKIARQNAVAKIWPLMGYALKERLSGDGK